MKTMRTFIVTMSCILGIAFGLSGCSGEKSAAYHPGTYTSSASGYGGDVTVEVTFDRESILCVTVLEHSETPSVADRALEEIPEQIVKAQTSDVDAVTSATITSDAVKTAVADCIQQATQE